jgi:hypothetical protein
MNDDHRGVRERNIRLSIRGPGNDFAGGAKNLDDDLVQLRPILLKRQLEQQGRVDVIADKSIATYRLGFD